MTGVALIALVFGVLIVDPSRFVERRVAPPDEIVARASAYEGTWTLSRYGKRVGTLRVRALYDRIAVEQRGLVRSALACRNGWYVPLEVVPLEVGPGEVVPSRNRPSISFEAVELYLSTQRLRDAITVEGADGFRAEFPRAAMWAYAMNGWELERLDTFTAQR